MAINHPKVFFINYSPGMGGDFFTQWLSSHPDFYPIAGQQSQDTKRYLIDHPLSGSGFDSVKVAYRPEHLTEHIGPLAAKVDAEYNEKHLIINSHYQGPVDPLQVLPRLVPIELVCDDADKPLFCILAFLKLYLHENDGGRLGLIMLAKRMLADPEFTGVIRNPNRPVELVRILWDRLFVNRQQHPGYYHLNVSDLYRDPAEHIDQWYDIFEINADADTVINDIRTVGNKAVDDIKIIERTFGMKIERLLDPTMKLDWISRLEQYVGERLDVYHKNAENV